MRRWLAKAEAAAGPGALLAICGLYCWEALRAPFMGVADWLSNLLPIIQYRSSILIDHALPNFTPLWYGGRFQWQNPLWSFLYFPATLTWLVFPLDWAARLVTMVHLGAAALVGYRLAGHWLQCRLERVLGALLLISPVMAALYLGHLEKLLAWPWVLLGFYSLLHPAWADAKRGLVAGLSLGVIALTGANYYVLYAGLCYLPIALTLSRRGVAGLIGASLLGLLHLPSVWFLVGQARGALTRYIPGYSLTLPQVIQALFIGIVEPAYLTWESFSAIGLAMAFAVVLFVFSPFFRRQIEPRQRKPMLALLIAAACLTVAATGLLNQAVSWLDTFRVPARAMAFVAVCLILVVMPGMSGAARRGRRTEVLRLSLLILAVAQICVAWWRVRPTGSSEWLDNSGAQALAQTLKQQGAQSVWTTGDAATAEPLIDVALNLEQISLPNAYYGEMNQVITTQGTHCGYSFDYLLLKEALPQTDLYPLYTTNWPVRLAGLVHTGDLRLFQHISAVGTQWHVYHVVCSP